MAGTDLKKRLAAILAADVVDYARLMSADDRATVAALDKTHAVCRKHIGHNQGRVVDMAGDSVLAVFESATGAVTASLAIQHNLASAFASMPEKNRMRLRIGVHLGDVIEKPDGKVYGDGVNIAARLQAKAEPGGIMVSDAIQGAIRGRILASFIDKGEQQVKNIPYGVRAFSVSNEDRPVDKSTTAVPRAHPENSTSASQSGADMLPSSTERSMSTGTGTLLPAERAVAMDQAMKILLVEDHPGYRVALAGLLKQLNPNVQIIEADNGDSAMTQASAESDINLILLDLYVPGINGFDLLATFKRNLPKVRVIVISADKAQKSMRKAIRNGAMGYIPKDTKWDLMPPALSLVLAGGIYLPPELLGNAGKRNSAPALRADVSNPAKLTLTPRQMAVLRSVLLGMTAELICRELGITENEIEQEISAVLESLGVDTRAEAVIEASRRGLRLSV